MQNHWDFGRIGGLPVSLHWTALMAFPWLFLWMQNLVSALIGTVAFMVLMLAHEFGHVFAARLCKVPVYSILIAGMHGETARGYARSRGQEVFIAWGGVLAQLLVLIVAVAWMAAVAHSDSRVVDAIAGPVFVVWTQWNVFLMVVALLPIGPMDGHMAWKIFPLIRDSFRNRGGNGKVVKLSAARRQALQQDSERKVVDIMERLKKK